MLDLDTLVTYGLYGLDVASVEFSCTHLSFRHCTPKPCTVHMLAHTILFVLYNVYADSIMDHHETSVAEGKKLPFCKEG